MDGTRAGQTDITDDAVDDEARLCCCSAMSNSKEDTRPSSNATALLKSTAAVDSRSMDSQSDRNHCEVSCDASTDG